jgi:hypothetical protein
MVIRGVGEFLAELSKDCLGWNKINRPSPKEDFMNLRRIAHYSFVALLFILTVAAPSHARAQIASGEFTARMTENSDALRQYVHLRKTEVYWNGKLRSTRFAEIHYDAPTGKETSEPLGSTSDNATSHGGPISMLISKKIAGDVKANIERLADLATQYLPLNADKIAAAFPRAQVTPALSGGATISFADYAQPGDTMTLTVDSHSKMTTLILVNSALDKKPVVLNSDFSSLANGLSYPSTTDMKWEAEKIEIRITNLDYHK